MTSARQAILDKKPWTCTRGVRWQCPVRLPMILTNFCKNSYVTYVVFLKKKYIILSEYWNSWFSVTQWVLGSSLPICAGKWFLFCSYWLIASKALSQSVSKPLSKTKSRKTSKTSKSNRRSTACRNESRFCIGMPVAMPNSRLQANQIKRQNGGRISKEWHVPPLSAMGPIILLLR